MHWHYLAIIIGMSRTSIMRRHLESIRTERFFHLELGIILFPLFSTNIFVHVLPTNLTNEFGFDLDHLGRWWFIACCCTDWIFRIFIVIKRNTGGKSFLLLLGTRGLVLWICLLGKNIETSVVAWKWFFVQSLARCIWRKQESIQNNASTII